MTRILGLTLALVLLGSPRLGADDIDIYLGGGGIQSSTPHLQLVLDWHPGLFLELCRYGFTCQDSATLIAGENCPPGQVCFSESAYRHLLRTPGALNREPAAGAPVTRWDALIAILGALFAEEGPGDVRMTILIANRVAGATILKGYRDLATRGDELLETLRAIPALESPASAHSLRPKHAFYEWLRYASGGEVLHATATAGNFGATGAPAPDFDASALDAAAPGRYASPFSGSDDCPRLFSMMVALGEVDDDRALDGVIQRELGFAVAGELAFTDMLAHLHKVDTDLLPTVSGVQPMEKTWVIADAASASRRDWARAGGTRVLDISEPLGLESALRQALMEIVSVSSTLVAATVPVSAYQQRRALDNLYIALFRAQAHQDWPGNLKRLRLVDHPDDADDRYDAVVDVDRNPGLETTGANTGRIAAGALTYWTDVLSLPPAPAASSLDAADPDYIPPGADGRVVTRGGAGQKIPGFISGAGASIGDVTGPDTRRLFVEDPAAPGGLTGFDASDSVAAGLQRALGATSLAEAKELIRWGRGQRATGDGATPRAWILSEILHSRPLAVNYGGAGGAGYDRARNPNLRLFFGSGSGVFHVLENTRPDGEDSGRELFGFVPRETLANLKVRSHLSESSLSMRYGVDGEPAALVIDANGDGDLDAADGDEVYVYFGMRRGGHSYHALDVSDPSPGAVPQLAWSITRGDPGFEELGLTFSTPVVGRVRFGRAATDAVIFAGGYHGGWDPGRTHRVGKDFGADDDIAEGVSTGNAIYIVDARSGDLIWKAVAGAAAPSNTVFRHPELLDSIPSTVAPLYDAEGNIHRLYFGDTGGAIWRVDLPAGHADNQRMDHWTIAKLAELGEDGSTTDRRFFHAPDLVQTFDASSDYDGILIASGNRAAPLEDEVLNYLFYIKDRYPVSGTRPRDAVPLELHDLPDQTHCAPDADPGTSQCVADLSAGWRIALTRRGEKGLARPLVDGGRAFFSTYVPPEPAVACGPREGSGHLYVVTLSDGTAAANAQRSYALGPGIPAGAIALGELILLPNGGADLHDIDGDGDLDTSILVPSFNARHHRTYWRELGADSL